MSYSIYIGDIDPNNTVNPTQHVRDIRRAILFRLLLWDSIVLSDSQFLTDPCIAMMMDGFSEKKMGDHDAWDDISEWQRGFEKLLEIGLVEVAHRTDIYGEQYTMLDVWNSMHNNPSASVPFLPPTPAYAKFLDTLPHQKKQYNLNSISQRFKSNLHNGISSGDFQLNPFDDTDRELTKILNITVQAV